MHFKKLYLEVIEPAFRISGWYFILAGTPIVLVATVGAHINYLPWFLGEQLQWVVTIWFMYQASQILLPRRVMELDVSHRKFQVDMCDVARAYNIAHSADRDGAFKLQSEYDSMRKRLNFMCKHPDLQDIRPELIELAAQMSYHTRGLAETFSTKNVERARACLTAREEDVAEFNERLNQAKAITTELRSWYEHIECDEAVVRSQLNRLKKELNEIIPELFQSDAQVNVHALRQPAE